ncbi:MAG: lyase family protein [Candidatus Udaeobacter sp.]
MSKSDRCSSAWAGRARRIDHALDPEFLARALGFTRVRIDAISDPDFVCEFVFCLAMIGLRLSRLSEDLIIWSTIKFGYIELSDAFSTGSSLMR